MLLDSQQNWIDSTENAHVPFPLLHCQHPSALWLWLREPTRTSWSPMAYIRAHSLFTSFGFWKCITSFHLYSLIALNPVFSVVHPCPILTPDNLCSFYCLHSVTFPRMSFTWIYIVCGLFRLFLFYRAFWQVFMRCYRWQGMSKRLNH